MHLQKSYDQFLLLYFRNRQNSLYTYIRDLKYEVHLP